MFPCYFFMRKFKIQTKRFKFFLFTLLFKIYLYRLFIFSGRKSHLRKTSHKVAPKPETVKRIHSSHVWKMEQAFYEFVRDQFNFIKNQIFDVVDGAYVERGNLFRYEKIRPR